MTNAASESTRWRPLEAATGVLREGFVRFRNAPEPGQSRLERPARMFLWGVVLCAAVASGVALAGGDFGRGGIGLILLLFGCAAIAQLFIVEKPGSQSYRMAIVFLLTAALLLAPAIVAAIAALHYVPSWFRHKRRWYTRAFNVSCTVLSALAAWVLYDALADDIAFVLAAAAAAAAFVAVNHVLLALMIRIARGTKLRDTGLFSVESLSTDLALAALGAGVVVVWEANPWTLVFVALAPLVLIHRALHVPQLEVEAKVDPKTGLLNAREFEAAFTEELARAERAVTPLALLMIDLDLLRDINNTYGHLAGDAVIRAIADVLRAELRRVDVSSRFGGEEYAVLLPTTDQEDAREVAERIRAGVAEQEVLVETAPKPLRASVSIGIATYPWHGKTRKELVQAADEALYRAKEEGRNRVVASGDPPSGLSAVITA